MNRLVGTRRTFYQAQKTHFRSANERRFRWQTENPFIREREHELLRFILKRQGGRTLEIGCGEGANIVNLRLLGHEARVVGVDYSKEKTAFCGTQKIKKCQFVCADALELPFCDNSFDFVFCRDLLHHVFDLSKKAILEMLRVCKVGSEIAIVEPNGAKLTLALFAILSPAERGMLRSTPGRIRKLVTELEESIVIEEWRMLEASNLFRALLHYTFGFPSLARSRVITRALKRLDRFCEKVIPKTRWAYSLVTVRKAR